MGLASVDMYHSQALDVQSQQVGLHGQPVGGGGGRAANKIQYLVDREPQGGSGDSALCT